jgi:hypothetical protein
MNTIDIVLVAWLAVNVLTVLLAINWAASRNRAVHVRAHRMAQTAERHASAAAPVGQPVSSVRRRASATARPW